MEQLYPEYGCKVVFFVDIPYFFIPLGKSPLLSESKIKKLVENQTIIYCKKRASLGVKDLELGNKEKSLISYVYKRYKNGIEVFVFRYPLQLKDWKKYTCVVPYISLIKELHDKQKSQVSLKDEISVATEGEGSIEHKNISSFKNNKRIITLGTYSFQHPTKEDYKLFVFIASFVDSPQTLFLDYFEIPKDQEEINLKNYQREAVQYLRREYKAEVYLFDIVSVEEQLEHILSQISSSLCFWKKKDYHLRELCISILLLALFINVYFITKQKQQLDRYVQQHGKLASQFSMLQSRLLNIKRNNILLMHVPTSVNQEWSFDQVVSFLSRKIYQKDKIWIDYFVVDRSIPVNGGLVSFKVNIVATNQDVIKNLYAHLYPVLQLYKIKNFNVSRRDKYIILSITCELKNTDIGVNYEKTAKLYKQKFSSNISVSGNSQYRLFSLEYVPIQAVAFFSNEREKIGSTNTSSFLSIKKCFFSIKTKIFDFAREFLSPKFAYASEPGAFKSTLYKSKSDKPSQGSQQGEGERKNIQSLTGGKGQFASNERDIEEFASFLEHYKGRSSKQQSIFAGVCSDNPEKIRKFLDRNTIDFMAKPSFLQYVTKINKERKNEDEWRKFISKVSSVLNNQKEIQKGFDIKSIAVEPLIITHNLALLKVNSEIKEAKVNDIIDNRLKVVKIDVEKGIVYLKDIIAFGSDLIEASILPKLEEWKIGDSFLYDKGQESLTLVKKESIKVIRRQ